jgi:hypothetical protein
LIWSSAAGKLDVVKYLVENGADIKAGYKNEALRYSQGNRYTGVADYLESVINN